MNVLITGVAGLIGARMADWIVANIPNSTVVGIDDLSGGYMDNVNKDVIFYNRNLVSDDISDIFDKHEINLVYHFAAYAAEGLSPFIRTYNYQNNLVSTANIVNNCINYDVDRIVFTSSMAVYGVGNPPFVETANPSPIDPYGVAKYGCEMDIQIAGEQHGLDWCIIRPHNVYGVKQNIWDKYRNVLGIWMNQYLKGEPMTIFGDGEQTRAFSFIDDCLEPFWKAGVNENTSKEIINLGGTVEYSINEANRLLLEIIGDGETKYLEGRHEVKVAHPTWEKSVKLLDYKDSTSLRDGLKIMWEWVKEQPRRHTFVWDKYEVDKGIYKFWKK